MLYATALYIPELHFVNLFTRCYQIWSQVTSQSDPAFSRYVTYISLVIISLNSSARQTATDNSKWTVCWAGCSAAPSSALLVTRCHRNNEWFRKVTLCSWHMLTNEQNRKWTCKRDTEVRSSNHFCYNGKAISITYSQYVTVALVIQHTKNMRRVILSSVACLPLPYFFTLSHKRHKFWGKKVT
jgi:hypothetical protein